MNLIKSIKLLNDIISTINLIPNKTLIITNQISLNRYDNDIHRKRAAVLIPICLRHNELSFLFTLRSTKVGTHRGQVSFPGGHIEANESVIDAAIRETNEELGNNIGNVKVLGICQTIPAITGTLVTPVLGFVENDILDFERLNPNADEVSRIFTRSIDTLLSRDYRIIEKLSRNGEFAEMPAFGTGDEKIWGLTAVILDSVLTNLVIPNYNNNNLH